MAKAIRELTVLKRAVCKKASAAYGVQIGDLIFLVKNDKEDVYVTTLRNTGKHTCTCQGNASFGRKCYHIKHVECQENIRRESTALAPEFAAVKVPVWAMWLLEAGVLALPSKSTVMTADHEEVPPIAMDLPPELKGRGKKLVASDLSTEGSLNGAQQSAGLLMSLPSRKAKAS